MNPILAHFHTQGPSDLMADFLRIAPYYRTIKPQLEGLDTGLSDLRLVAEKPYADSNGRFEPGAMFSAALLSVALMASASAPEGRKWFLTGITAEFPDLGRFEAIAVADGRSIDWQQPGIYTVSISIVDLTDRPYFTGSATVTVV